MRGEALANLLKLSPGIATCNVVQLEAGIGTCYSPSGLNVNIYSASLACIQFTQENIRCNANMPDWLC